MTDNPHYTANRRGLAFIVCASHSTPDYKLCTLDCGNTAADCERCFGDEMADSDSGLDVD